MRIYTSQEYSIGYESPPIYGRTICLIGPSNLDEDHELQINAYRPKTFLDAVTTFGECSLSYAYKEANDAGAKNIYIISIPQLDLETLQKAYQVSETIHVHTLILIDMYLDDENYDYAQSLAEHCNKASNGYGNRIGIIGVKPIHDTEINVFEYVKSLINNTRMKKGFYNNNGDDIGSFISVVVAEPIFYNEVANQYVANGAAAYAGLLASIYASQSPSYKTINGIDSLSYEFPTDILEDVSFTEEMSKAPLKEKPVEAVTVSNLDSNITYVQNKDYKIYYDTDIDMWTIERLPSSNIPADGSIITVMYGIDLQASLAEAGYVTFSSNARKGIFPETGTTASKSTTLKSIQSVRATQAIIYAIKNAGQEFIGNTMPQTLEFEDWVSQFLNELVQSSQIKDYEVSFEYEKDKITVYLNLSLYSEIREISVSIDVS